MRRSVVMVRQWIDKCLKFAMSRLSDDTVLWLLFNTRKTTVISYSVNAGFLKSGYVVIVKQRYWFIFNNVLWAFCDEDSNQHISRRLKLPLYLANLYIVFKILIHKVMFRPMGRIHIKTSKPRSPVTYKSSNCYVPAQSRLQEMRLQPKLYYAPSPYQGELVDGLYVHMYKKKKGGER